MTIKNNLKYLAITGVVLVVIISGSLLYTLKNRLKSSSPPSKLGDDIVNPVDTTVPVLALNSFKSCQDILGNLQDYQKQQNLQQKQNYRYSQPVSAPTAQDTKSSVSAPNASSTPSSSTVYSGTNNQVQNVDEGDIIKTDGKNIYTVNGRNINITQVDPQTGSISKLAKISLSKSFQSVTQLNLYKNYLLITGSGSSSYGGLAVIGVYDVSESSNPKLVRELAMDGNISTTRMVGSVVYVVNNFNNYQFSNILSDSNQGTLESSTLLPATSPNIIENATKIEQIQQNLPKIQDSLSSDKPTNITSCENIKYIKPIQSIDFTAVLALDLENPKGELGKELVLGSGQNVYASEKNLYLAQTNYNSQQIQKTSIFKFNLDGIKVKFQTQAEILGTILNQFSMDEFENNLRVSAHHNQFYQAQSVFSGFFGDQFNIFPFTNPRSSTPESNSITVFDADLKQIGLVQNIAPGEQIYATRFMGKKGYLVTFKSVDPFFVLDLSDPKDPKITGQLKIPGFSNYLHPISENLIIGIGKNATEGVDSFGDETGFAWYQGLKLGLFDVSDTNNPKELAKVEIGDRGTDSVVLSDHKALLWDSRNNLLTIPVNLMLIPQEQKAERDKNIAAGGAVYPLYGQFKYQGSYVYEVTPSDGFKLKGRISHIETKAKIETTNQTLDRKYDEFGQLLPSDETNSAPTSNPNTRPSCGAVGQNCVMPRIAIGEPYPGQNDYQYYINRQLYINNFLITSSAKQLQSNRTSDLSLINNVGF